MITLFLQFFHLDTREINFGDRKITLIEALSPDFEQNSKVLSKLVDWLINHPVFADIEIYIKNTSTAYITNVMRIISQLEIDNFLKDFEMFLKVGLFSSEEA